MPRQHVIADSDDDDCSSLTPLDEIDSRLNSPEREGSFAPGAVDVPSVFQAYGEDDDEPSLLAPPTVAATTGSGATGSTDPSFFRAVYDEQRRIALGHRDNATDHVQLQAGEVLGEVFEAEDDTATSSGKKGAAGNSSSMTSVTDPGRRKKAGANKGNISDLTQVTTPRRSDRTEAADVWDVPNSAERGGPPPPRHQLELAEEGEMSAASRRTRSAGKRKRAAEDPTQSPGYELLDGAGHLASNADFHDESLVMSRGFDERPDATPVPSKKRQKRTQQPAPEISPNAPPTAIYIQLTEKEMDESLILVEGAAVADSLQGPGLPTGSGAQKSTGATTVAFPTPTEYASSSRRGRTVQSSAASRVVEVEQQPADMAEVNPHTLFQHDMPYLTANQVASSPDIITTSSSRQSRLKKGKTAKTHAAKYLSDEEQNPEDQDPELESTMPRSRRTKSTRSRPSKISEVIALDSSDDDDGHHSKSLQVESEPESDAPPVKPAKKRGRKKKESQPAAVPDVPSLAQSGKKGKQGRGRPRKSEPVAVLEDMAPNKNEDGNGAQTGGEAVETAVASEKNDSAVLRESRINNAPQPKPTREDSSRQAGNEKQTAPPELSVKMDETKAAAAKQGSKDATKAAPKATQPGKALYRVGLSKTSRIAPLLKIIRK